MTSIQKILLIIRSGEASKAFQIAKEAGANGGTIMLGQGTSGNRWLKMLGLDDIRKEVLIILAPREVAKHTALQLVNKLQLEKPNHGILALQSIQRCYGSKGLGTCEDIGGDEVSKYVMITVIVDRGKSEEVMEAATLAGAKGGTIVHGRGSGTKEYGTVFNVPIMPEKDIILLLIESELAEGIVDSIMEHLDIEEPGQGLIYVQPVEEIYGMSKTIDHLIEE